MPRIPRHVSLATCVATLCALFAVTPAIASAASVQFGAWNPGEPYYANTNGADALQAATGRHVDIVNWYQNWGGGDWISAVQPHVIGAVTGSGRAPLLTWEPWTPGAGTSQAQYRLARIANGDFDAYMRTWATQLKALGSTIYLRPMHEMNGNWYPWSGVTNGNSPAVYVQAWRRMVGVFRGAGASNVRFVWSPNNVDVPSSNTMERYYPGSSYVDVLAVDGYNWGATAPENGGWQSFNSVFRRAYDRLRALGPQPIWIAEVGTAPEGGDKAAWIRDMFAQAQTMDRLQAIVWFNENKERDWRANPSPEIAAAFAPLATTAALPATRPAPATRAAAGATPKLTLTVTPPRTRTGDTAVVRWRARSAPTVTRWHAYLNGRRVKTTTRRGPRVAHRRVTRSGRYRWTVVGRDGRSHRVVSATRSFRVGR